ncbi:sigma-70 family RNA polymerase sigma factor [uncultured Thalassospira sp.]|uniref:sigma-70 family RNA polymerase sigma factor n=1 Tax=uncultured Thalassospira sp. TaxID=404382 RepID=UPI0030D88E92
MSTAIFEQLRPRLFALAFRMLGSHADAEDAVQDVWLRWQNTDAASLKDPVGWLVRVCSNLCLDVLKSARRRRENYVGNWLPEPWVNPFANDTEAALMDQDSLSQAYLMMLEKLSPSERIALVLHDVFDWDHTAIAKALGNQPNNARQILFRARRKMQDQGASEQGKPATDMRGVAAVLSGEAGRAQRLKRDDLADFIAALQSGRADRIAALLSPDVMLQSDGGGKASVNLNILFGTDHVARFFAGVWRKNFATSDILIRESEADSWVLFARDGVVHSAITFTVNNGSIDRVFVHRNPDKLAVFQPIDKARFL